MGDAAEAHIGELRAALREEDPILQATAAWALAGLGPKARAALPDLREALKSRQLHVREGVLWALGRIVEDRRPLGSALAALESPRADIRESAALDLASMGREGAEAAPRLASLLSDPEWGVRQAAAMALGT